MSELPIIERSMTNQIISDINIKTILNKIPHRYPFILVDKVKTLEPGVSITAIKNVTSNEGCFQGHFPGNPVMPGVLIIESLAQACAVLFIYSIEHNKLPSFVPPKNGTFLFAGINDVRFKKVVQPGDQLILDCEFVKYRKGIAKFAVQASVDGQVACKAEILSAYRDME